MKVIPRGDAWQVQGTLSGRRYRKQFPTQARAVECMEELIRRDKAGTYSTTTTPTDPTLDRQGATMKQLAERTSLRFWKGAKAERSSVFNADDCVKELGPNTKPSSVTPAVIEEIINIWRKRNLSGATINRKLASLSKMMAYAVTLGWITSPPKITRLRESEHRLRWFTADEEAKVVRWLTDTAGRAEFADLVVLLIDTGLRLSEGLSLKWGEVEEKSVRVADGKTKASRRSVPMTTRVSAMLDRRRAGGDSDKVFPALSIHSVEKTWDRCRAALGFESDSQFVIHTLRHTFASRLVQKGVPIQVVQALLGHSSITMTMRYAHLNTGNLVNAIEFLNPPPTA